MLFVKSRKFKRLLVESSGPRSRCRRRRKSWVRIKRGWAEDCLGSIRHTAGSGGSAEKNSSSRAGSKSRPGSSSSTTTEYNELAQESAQGTTRFLLFRPNYSCAANATRVSFVPDTSTREPSKSAREPSKQAEQRLSRRVGKSGHL